MLQVQLLNELWYVVDPQDRSTWPDDEQKVYYIFTPLGEVPVFKGVFYCDDDGACFTSRGGFCDLYDAPFWRPREEDE